MFLAVIVLQIIVNTLELWHSFSSDTWPLKGTDFKEMVKKMGFKIKKQKNIAMKRQEFCG